MEKAAKDSLIDIYEVSALFGLSIEAIRKYKTLGLIEPFKRIGRKDLFVKEDVIFRRNLIDSLKIQGKSLQEISKAVNSDEFGQDLEKQNLNNNIYKILIIEDEKPVYDIIQKYLKMSFSENNIKIYYAKDGLNGIKEAVRIRPHIIIIDVALPVFSGIEVHKKLENIPENSNSKFIFISGSIKFEPEGTTFIHKPFELPTFIKTIENCTGIKAHKIEGRI